MPKFKVIGQTVQTGELGQTHKQTHKRTDGRSVKGQGHGQRSRSTLWRAAVDIRGSALPSAAKNNRSHYQSKVFVCESVISGCMWIIARMQSIGF